MGFISKIRAGSDTWVGTQGLAGGLQPGLGVNLLIRRGKQANVRWMSSHSGHPSLGTSVRTSGRRLEGASLPRGLAWQAGREAIRRTRNNAIRARAARRYGKRP